MGAWWPSFHYWENIWIAGSDKIGTLYFYKRPHRTENELGPALLIYESRGEPDPREKAKFLPVGDYLVLIDGQSFHAYHHTCKDLIYFYEDDGTGPKRMSANLETDKARYGKEDSFVLFSLQTRDEETGAYIQVNEIEGRIRLPDDTLKAVTTEDWCWNSEKELYEYLWDFRNNEGLCADPKEGNYSCEVTVEKSFYEDAHAETHFAVCYHIEIDVEFDKELREYFWGERVTMIAHVTDENGSPVHADLESVLVLPDGSQVTDLQWTETEPGAYTASYIPWQEGIYRLTVRVREDVICYLEEGSAVFFVKGCEEIFINLQVDNAYVNRTATLTLTVTDGNGNGLSGALITSELHLPDGSTVPLSWTEIGDGIYQTEYSFGYSSLGTYLVSGTVFILGENNCFGAFLNEFFEVTEKKLPDLEIRNEDIEIWPEPNLGETVMISVTVRNVGDADAENFYVVILINDKVVYKAFIEVLAQGESTTIEYEWYVEYSGGYIIQAIADPPEGLV